MDKTRLLNTLKTERARLEDLLAQIGEGQMSMPGVQDTWSVKDIVAHITVWDRRGTRWIQTAVRGETPQMPEPGMTWKDMDRLNAQTFVENQDRPLRDVMADFGAAYQRLRELVESLSQEEVNRSFHLRPNDELSVGDLVTWRYKHYRSHGRHIRVWLEKTASA